MNRIASVMLAVAVVGTGIGTNGIAVQASGASTLLANHADVSEEYIARDAIYDMNDNSVNRATSEHFQIIWGNSDATGTINREFIEGNLENLENIRSFYINELGMDDTGQSVSKPNLGDNYKTNVYISGTGLTKFENDWAYMSIDSDGFGYMFLDPGAMRVSPPSWVVPHEYAHVITYHQKGTVYGEWYESVANWYRDQYLGSSYYRNGNTVYGPTSDFFAPIVINSNYYFPHLKNYYDAWPMLLYMTENPDHMSGLGKELMLKIVKNGQVDDTMFDTIERLSGTSIKDILGGYARRMVTMDFERQASYLNYLEEQLRTAGNKEKIYTTLQNESDGWMRVPSDRAPQQGGYNIVPLNVNKKTGYINVNFKGDHVQGGDWRVSIVAKTASGETRYSNMWSDGMGSLKLQGDETNLYLVVCATPDEMLNLTCWDIDAVGTTYPYAIKVTTSQESVSTPTPEATITPTIIPTIEPEVTPVSTVVPTPVPTMQPTIAPTVQPDGKLAVELSGSTSTISNTISKQITLDILDHSSYDLSKMKVRYYYTADGNVDQTVWIDNAAIKYTCAPWYTNINASVKAQIKALNYPTDLADHYLELSFEDATIIDQSASTMVAFRIAKNDWSSFNEANDHSYNDAQKIAIYYDNMLICGTDLN